jgi:hypothetical protein
MFFTVMSRTALQPTQFYIFVFIYGLFTDVVSDLNTVGIATGYELDDKGVGVRVPIGSRVFSSPCRPDRLWDPPNLLSNEYWGGGSFPGDKEAGA